MTSAGGLVVFSVDHRTSSLVSDLVRHLIARLTAWLTLGNRKSEFGERVLDNELFWHCHSEASVRRELNASDLEIIEVIPGEQDQPMFVFCRPRSAESARGQRRVNTLTTNNQPFQTA